MPEGVLRAELEGDEVLLNPTTGVYHLLNRSGRRLVSAFDAGSTLEEAVEALATDSGIDVERAREDSESFVRAMVDRGLLEEAS
jgi:hypothetical protein